MAASDDSPRSGLQLLSNAAAAATQPEDDEGPDAPLSTPAASGIGEYSFYIILKTEMPVGGHQATRAPGVDAQIIIGLGASPSSASPPGAAVRAAAAVGSSPFLETAAASPRPAIAPGSTGKATVSSNDLTCVYSQH